MNDEILNVLKELKRNDFRKPVWNCPYSAVVNETLRECLSVAEINKRDLCFHSLRHIHVTYSYRKKSTSLPLQRD